MPVDVTGGIETSSSTTVFTTALKMASHGETLRSRWALVYPGLPSFREPHLVTYLPLSALPNPTVQPGLAFLASERGDPVLGTGFCLRVCGQMQLIIT